MKKKDPEFVEVLGIREMDSDGFGYSYGKYKFSSRSMRNCKNGADRSRRRHKKRVKRLAFSRELRDCA